MPNLTRSLSCVAVLTVTLILSLSSLASADPEAPTPPPSDGMGRLKASYDATGKVWVGAEVGSGSSVQAPAQSSTARRPAAAYGAPASADEPPPLLSGQAALGCVCTVGPTGEPLVICPPAQEETPAPAATSAPVKPLVQSVREAVAMLSLPEGVPVVAPDPANNEWGMIPIGFPIWLTTTAPKTATASASQDGIDIAITATRGKTVFHMGEQKVMSPNVTCTGMPQRLVHEYPANRKSPDCGYVYRYMGTYTITASTTWHIDWSANGRTGTMDVVRDAQAAKPLVIGQLKAVVTSVGP